MIVGVIDIGSNTIRFSVYEVDKKKDTILNLFNEKVTAGLASYKEDNLLSKKGIQRLLETMESFQTIIHNFEEIEEVFAFATASIRQVENASAIIDLVKEETGISIQVLSGEEEAFLAYKGAKEYVEDVENGVLTDIGGGSTEVVLFKNEKIINSASLNFGSLSVYKEYAQGLFLTDEEKKIVDSMIKEELAQEDLDRNSWDVLCAVGGSARAALKLYNDYFDEHPKNIVMRTDDLKTLLNVHLAMENKEKMNAFLRMKADRIHTFLPGMVILYRIAKYFHVEDISVSQTGVREGYVRYYCLERG